MTDIRFEDYHRLIRGLAGKAHRRLVASGATNMDRKDIEQEMIVTFCICRDKWDASKGVPFGAYLTQAIWNNWNRLMDGQNSASAKESSLDNSVGDGDGSFYDLLPDQSESVEQRVLGQEARERLLRRVSPLTRQVIELLEHPHPLFVGELMAMRDQRALARRKGIGTAAMPGEYGIRFLLHALGLGTRQRVEVAEEIQAILELQS